MHLFVYICWLNVYLGRHLKNQAIYITFSNWHFHIGLCKREHLNDLIDLNSIKDLNYFGLILLLKSCNFILHQILAPWD